MAARWRRAWAAWASEPSSSPSHRHDTKGGSPRGGPPFGVQCGLGARGAGGMPCRNSGVPDLDDSPLTLGPLLRYVGETRATVWVQTRRHGDRARCGRSAGRGRRRRSPRTATTTRWWSSTASSRGRAATYQVDIDGEQVWPPSRGRSSPASPPSRIPTLRATASRPGWPSGRAARASPHDAEGNESNGVDALRAYAYHLSRTDARRSGRTSCCFLGDQVYADETSEEMREFIAVAAQPRRAAGRGAQGLRGVRPPLPAGVDRPAEPVAAVDPAERDDLRRPRHPRRLEHLESTGAAR